MRFDNGHPWGTNSPVPSALALWLAGLDVRPVFGRPRQSTDNAVVERAHGVLNGWADPACCATRHQLSHELARFATLQRERYPLSDGTPRLVRFPELSACPRPYSPADEQQLWSIQRVWDYLATFRFYRKVERNGRITLLHGEYSVGRAYQRRTLAVQLDPQAQEWVVYAENGDEIRRFPPKNLSYATIASMSLSTRQRGKP